MIKGIVREAKPEDARFVVPLIVQAMDDLAGEFTGGGKEAEIMHFFEKLYLQKSNQYSFEHTLVYEEADKILGSITSYDGKYSKEYTRNLVAYITKEFNLPELDLADESQAGELYIDTLSVSPLAQGKGLGTILIKAVIEKAKKEAFQHVGLLVDKDNPNAKRLYQRLGFVDVGELSLSGIVYQHMQVLL